MKYGVGILAVGSVVAVILGADCESGGPAVSLLPQFTLEAISDGEGQVWIVTDETRDVFEIDMFEEGALVSLSAEPAEGWIFTGWADAVEGDGSQLEMSVTADTSVTATFAPMAGVRTVTINGVLGRMTLAIRDQQARGNLRVGDLGADLKGTFIDGEFELTSTSPGFSDAEITLTRNEDGSLTGVIDGSGFDNDPMTADPLAMVWLMDDNAGQRTTNIDGTSGFMTVVINGNLLRGTWRVFGSIGGDIEGSFIDGAIEFTAIIPGLETATVNASVQADGSWLGTIDGSGYSNAPFEAQPSFFP